MPKRAAPSPKKQVASPKQTTKKAKTMQSPEAKPETPLLAALEQAEHVPKACRDMLQMALSRCLSTSCSERHKYQAELLDGISNVFAQMEEQKRTARGEAMAKVVSLQAEKEAVSTDMVAKKSSASSKKELSDEKGKFVEEAASAVKAAEIAVADAQKMQSDCEAQSKQLSADLGNFEELVSVHYTPLKAGTFAGNEWRKRNKVLGELLQKLSEASIEGSLLDAMDMVLKTKPDQRSAFSVLVLEHAEAFFASHKEQMVQQRSGLDEQANTHQKAHEAAQGVLDEKISTKKKAEEEWDTEQNEWVDLENKAAEAERSLKDLENALDEANEEVEALNNDLEKFLEVPALFAKLKDPVEVTQPDEVVAAPMESAEVTEQPEPVQVEVA
jgi:hypothetical protein